VRFKTFFYFFIFISLVALFLDYSLTVYGFSKHFAIMEINPFIMFFMRFMQPTIAATLVLHITLVLILGSYWMVRKFFENPPYNRELRDVWRYLMRSNGPKGRDIAVFSLIALYSYFAYSHFMGAWTWIDLFRTVGI